VTGHRVAGALVFTLRAPDDPSAGVDRPGSTRWTRSGLGKIAAALGITVSRSHLLPWVFLNVAMDLNRP
jgi:hypothetical protein